MRKNSALVTGRSPRLDSQWALLLPLVALVLVGGCTAARPSAAFHQASELWEPAGPRAPGEERGGAGAAHGQDAPAAGGCGRPPPGWPDREQLGGEGLQEVARYLRADSEAALFVIEGGEAGVAALYEARGHVPKARAWLSQASSERPGSTRTRGGAGKSPGSGASHADEAGGLAREVLDARLLEAELDVSGPRLSGDVAVLEKQLGALEKTPPAGANGHPLWSEYLKYGKERLADLEQGRKVRKGRKLEPPLQWEGYQKMRGLVTRGLAFERDMAEQLRADAAHPKARRHVLQDFNEPLVETNVGVAKPGVDGVRYADVLVIEKQPPSGQPPRVETFSFKSRDLSRLAPKALDAQMIADASEALAYYGGTLDIRRPGLKLRVEVQRVRLIYEGGQFKPRDSDVLRAAENATEKAVPGVEVLFQ